MTADDGPIFAGSGFGLPVPNRTTRVSCASAAAQTAKTNARRISGASITRGVWQLVFGGAPAERRRYRRSNGSAKRESVLLAQIVHCLPTGLFVIWLRGSPDTRRPHMFPF